MGEHRRGSKDLPAGRSRPASLSLEGFPGRSRQGSLSLDGLPSRSRQGSLDLPGGRSQPGSQVLDQLLAGHTQPESPVLDLPASRSQSGSLLLDIQPRVEGGAEEGQGIPETVFERRGSREPKSRDVEDGGLGALVEEELPPEEAAVEEEPSNPEDTLSELQQMLQKDGEEDVSEMSRLSITQRFPRRGRRLRDLARPKTDWQGAKDRSTRRRRGPRIKLTFKGYTWVSPCMKRLHFCIYWPSVYWTERFIKDTTLSITVPAVSRRVEELARPKRFYSEYYNNNRRTAAWPIQRPTLEYRATNRLRELATPKPRNNIWNLGMSQVSQVSKAAQTAVPSQRTVRLARPRPPATLAEEWDPLPKPKPYVSDYNRLLQLATPKGLSEKCLPNRSPLWEVQEGTKKAVASPRILSLAQPRVRKALNEGYDPYHVSPASLLARASPRLTELATPKSVTRRA